MSESPHFTTPFDVNEPWYWTGETMTKECGCTFDELGATDGRDPVWMGKVMCDRHLERAAKRARELQEEGILPKTEGL